MAMATATGVAAVEMADIADMITVMDAEMIAATDMATATVIGDNFAKALLG